MSPKEITKFTITEAVFKEPMEVIKELSGKLDLKYTKVIQTYVMEDRKMSFVLEKSGATIFKGKIVWIGNKKDESEGTIFCVDSGTELKQINPTKENTGSVTLDTKKDVILISTVSTAKCSVCGKDIEIFDEISGCPICQAKAHRVHLLDWIKMKHSCPICKKSLNISSVGSIIIE